MSDVVVRQQQKRRAGVTAEALVIALLFGLLIICEAPGLVASSLVRMRNRR